MPSGHVQLCSTSGAHPDIARKCSELFLLHSANCVDCALSENDSRNTVLEHGTSFSARFFCGQCALTRVVVRCFGAA